MAHPILKPVPAQALGRYFHGFATRIGMTVEWILLSLKMEIEWLMGVLLRPGSTTILDIPAEPAQFPPIGTIRKELLALAEPANDESEERDRER